MRKSVKRMASVLSLLLALTLAGQAAFVGAEELIFSPDAAAEAEVFAAEDPAEEAVAFAAEDPAEPAVEIEAADELFEDDFVFEDGEAFAEEEAAEEDFLTDGEAAADDGELPAEELPEEEAAEEETIGEDLFEDTEDLLFADSEEFEVDEEESGAPITGPCGTNMSYSLEDGTLTISMDDGSTADMDDYTDLEGGNPAPWAPKRNSIKKIVISNKNGVVRTIGEYAFANLKYLTTVTFDGTGTEEIGHFAFYNCTSLQTLKFPKGLKFIGQMACCECSALSSVTIPDTVTEVQAYAFMNCPALKKVAIPGSVTSIGPEAFGYTYDEAESTYTPIKDFTIETPEGSEGDTYAINNKFKIISDLSAAAIALPKKSYPYTGSAIKPAVTVICKETALVSGTDFTVSYKNNTKIGTATVTVKGTGNYCGSKSITFDITPKPVKAADIEVTLAYTSIGYNGSARKPAVKSVKAAGEELEDTEYTVTYEAGRINVGKYKVTVKLTGDYSGTKTVTFQIVPVYCTASDITVKLAYTSTWYNGSARKPAVQSVRAKDKTMAAADYTVTYQDGRINVGRYKVTIKLKGNYSGTKTVYFKIRPKRNSIKYVKALKGGFGVKYTKHTKQTTGYQVQYSRKSDFSKNTNTVIVPDKSKTYVKVMDLVKSVKYYVRVRTYMDVKGVRYVSTWTTAETVTVN